VAIKGSKEFLKFRGIGKRLRSPQRPKLQLLAL
jgi:hypothetical protein